MQVAQYIFQSPSPNPVQVGRLDPNSVKEESKKENSSSPASVVENQILSDAKRFESSQVQEVKPSVTSNSLDIYA